MEGLKGQGGKWGEAALGPESCVFGGGKGIMSFIHLLPGVLSDWTRSIEWEVADGAFETPHAAILLALGSSPGRPPRQDNSLVSVCVCVCAHALRFVPEPTFKSRQPVGGQMIELITGMLLSGSGTSKQYQTQVKQGLGY